MDFQRCVVNSRINFNEQCVKLCESLYQRTTYHTANVGPVTLFRPLINIHSTLVLKLLCLFYPGTTVAMGPVTPARPLHSPDRTGHGGAPCHTQRLIHSQGPGEEELPLQMCGRYQKGR